jgi:hypothetical protein
MRTAMAIGREVGEVEEIVTRLRDGFIYHVRHAGMSPAVPRWHTALKHINTALSLIAGAEYRVARRQRSALEQAAETLAQVFDTG